jgi:HEAT repeat protein
MKHLLKSLLFIFLPFIVFSAPDDFLRRIECHFLLEDYEGAIKEIKKAESVFPNDKEIQKAYIRALIALGEENEAISVLNNLYSHVDLKNDPSILEDVAWGILKKGVNSSQYATRLSSLVGIYFTRDARAVSILKSMMKDTNAILRAVALQLSCNYRDEPLINEVVELFENEKIYLVRLEVLKTIGAMRIKSKEADLKEILKNDKATYDERALAVEALVNIYDKIDIAELKILLSSPYAGFRILGAEMGAHFKIAEVKKEIALLASDARFDVRIAALNSIALFYKDVIPKKEIKALLSKAYDDTNAYVAITASFVGLLVDPLAKKHMKKWLDDPYPENRRFAAGTVAHAGVHGKDLCLYALENSRDDFVRANVAIGLIGQRENLKKCADVIYDFIKNKKIMWMWENEGLFQILAPSEIRHIDQLPNYPEAIDQVVQLNLLSILSMLEDPRAQDAIKTFLKTKTWGITGLAAITLLQEGDEESLTLLKALLKDSDKTVRIQAALALAIIGKDKSALPILEKAYFDAPHDLKLNILEAIGRVGNMESFPFLLKVLEEPFQMLRIAAASAIIQTANL